MNRTGAAQSVLTNHQRFSSEELFRRTVERRAVEAVIWGTPAVNFDVMYQAMVRDAKSGDGSNKIVYWSRLFRLEEPDAHSQSRLDLLHGLLQYQGRRTRGARNPTCGRRLDHQRPRSMIAGKQPSKTSDPLALTKVKEANISSSLPDTKSRFPPATSPCSLTPIKGTHCSVPFSNATTTPASPTPSPTANGSNSIRSRRLLVQLRPNSSTPSTWFTMPTSRGICASFNHSIAWCR